MRIIEPSGFRKRLCERRRAGLPDVRSIVQAVRSQGDAALLRYTREFDGVDLETIIFHVPPQGELRDEDPGLWDALMECREAVYLHHVVQKRGIDFFPLPDGSLTGRMYTPLDKVGVYVPGGSRGYPSTVLMTLIPAGIAGVGEVVVTSPPGGAEPPLALLMALSIAGVPKFYRVGGPWAISAMAYGTESVPKVDKIVGPGNAFVTAAKREVYGDVDIDMLAGPSEIAVLADESAPAGCIAADMLSQAEHGTDSWATLVCTSSRLAGQVKEELERLLTLCEVDEASLDLVLVSSLEEGIDLVNEIAPEHVEIMVRHSLSVLPRIKKAGAVYIGAFSPCALGDYAAGPSHVLPTGGSARFSSGLSVETFLRAANVASFTREGFLQRAPAAERVARAEGMSLHAMALQARFERGESH